VSPNEAVAMTETAAKILVVDDSPEIVEHIAALLGDRGYDVSRAFDGDEAIAAAKRRAFDLIVMDVVMPRLSGLTACRVLKADPVVGRVPILLLTSEEDPETIVRGLAAGANDYVLKSVAREELLARVDRHLTMTASVREQVSAERLMAIGQIAISLQHEINNPLTSVLGFVDLVLRQPDLGDRARKYLQTARDEALRIREIIDRLNEVRDRPVNPYGVGEMIDLTPEP
jgi:two-component system sensor histidine kinase/response regulator